MKRKLSIEFVSEYIILLIITLILILINDTSIKFGLACLIYVIGIAFIRIKSKSSSELSFVFDSIIVTTAFSCFISSLIGDSNTTNYIGSSVIICFMFMNIMSTYIMNLNKN